MKIFKLIKNKKNNVIFINKKKKTKFIKLNLKK